jgi:hypothetical protein
MSRENADEIHARMQQSCEDQEAIDQLIEATRKVSDKRLTKFNLACKKGDADTVARLLESGKDPLQRKTRQGLPMGFAAAEGHLDVVLLLLEAGVHPDARGAHSMTCLHHAAGGGHLEVVRALLDRGASPNLIDGSCESALHEAVRNRDMLITEALVNAGASPNFGGTDADWSSPLDAAISSGAPDLILLLLEHGGDLRHGQHSNEKLREARAVSVQLDEAVTREREARPDLDEHLHVYDLEGEQSPTCPFCGNEAWKRQDYEEHQECMREETECEHEIFRTQWDRRFESSGPLSGSESVWRSFFPEPFAAPRRLRAAVNRLREHANDQGIDVSVLVQDVFGALPIWWNWREGVVDESITWILKAWPDLVSCSFCYEDPKFMGIVVDEIFYTKDPAALRRVFHDSISDDALRMEAWIQSHR